MAIQRSSNTVSFYRIFSYYLIFDVCIQTAFYDFNECIFLKRSYFEKLLSITTEVSISYMCWQTLIFSRTNLWNECEETAKLTFRCLYWLKLIWSVSAADSLVFWIFSSRVNSRASFLSLWRSNREIINIRTKFERNIFFFFKKAKDIYGYLL